MENVADALKMGFAVLIFVVALWVAFTLLGQANLTAREIFYSMDDVTYLDSARVWGTTPEDANHRIVGLETIIPTIYRYPVENCGVTIINKKEDGSYEIIARYDQSADSVAHCIDHFEKYKASSEKNKEYQQVKSDTVNYAKYISGVSMFLWENFAKTQTDENIKKLFKTDSYTSLTIDNQNYQGNKNLHNITKKMHKYKVGEKRETYGSPWGADFVKTKIEADLYGKACEYKEGTYNYYTDDEKINLMEELEGKKYKEYIVENDNTRDIAVELQDESGSIGGLATVYTQKMEIIFVQQ